MTNFIKVSDHFLWADGSIQVEPSALSQYLIKLGNKNALDKLFVTELTEEISQLNELSDQKIEIKSDLDQSKFPLEWTLPDHYKYLNLDEYLFGLVNKIEKDSFYDIRLNRLSEEIWLFKERGLEPILRVLIYVIDIMKQKNVVWGVGRGSSCSSYLLYLLDLHDIDPVRYGIEVTDFIR